VDSGKCGGKREKCSGIGGREEEMGRMGGREGREGKGRDGFGV